MKIEISSLSPEDLQYFIKWATERKAHYAKLLSDLENALEDQSQVSMPFNNEVDSIQPTNGYKGRDRTIDKIIKIMSGYGKWLGNGQIRALLKKQEGIELSSNGLLAHLHKNEGRYFRRKGDNKLTRWKAIVEYAEK